MLTYAAKVMIPTAFELFSKFMTLPYLLYTYITITALKLYKTFQILKFANIFFVGKNCANTKKTN